MKPAGHGSKVKRKASKCMVLTKRRARKDTDKGKGIRVVSDAVYAVCFDVMSYDV